VAGKKKRRFYFPLENVREGAHEDHGVVIGVATLNSRSEKEAWQNAAQRGHHRPFGNPVKEDVTSDCAVGPARSLSRRCSSRSAMQ
jgi:hypothetical protein